VKYNTKNIRAARPKGIIADILSNENNWIMHPMKANVVLQAMVYEYEL
jgi:hypothetical protein